MKNDLERFAKKFEVRGLTECWPWLAYRKPTGYGNFKLSGRTHRAHRAMWIFERGEIPAGLSVLHRCDTPACVNPNHLFLGTQKDNLKDMVHKGRHGHGNYRGPHRWFRKFSDSEAMTIRRMHDDEGITQRAIAKEFGCHQTTVHYICKRKVYKEL